MATTEVKWDADNKQTIKDLQLCWPQLEPIYNLRSKSCQLSPLFKLYGRNSAQHQRRTQIGKLQLHCNKKLNRTRKASKHQRTFNFVGPQLEPNYKLRPKILPTLLSTAQAEWQEQHTTPAVDSDQKVADQLQQEVKKSVLKFCQHCPLCKLSGKNSAQLQRRTQIGKSQLDCNKKLNRTQIAILSTQLY